MKLRYISLTGADDQVKIEDLEWLSKTYPLFECAILMFPEREALARNPSKAWREKFYQSSVKNRAIHLCGSAINKLANEDQELINELQHVGRVQINLKPQWASVELVQQLISVVQKYPQIEFITQHNELNTEYFQYWDKVANHSYLYDASLGKGLAPNEWLAPLEHKSTGYAGGMNNDNVVANLIKIFQKAGQTLVWIDMETGIRTNDQFDLWKCENVLARVTEYIG